MKQQRIEKFVSVFSNPDSERRNMEDLLKEVLTFAEGTGRWLNEAAQHFENLAAQLAAEEKAKLHLLAAVYRERAQISGNLISRRHPAMRARNLRPAGRKVRFQRHPQHIARFPIIADRRVSEFRLTFKAFQNPSRHGDTRPTITRPH
jgi:hypothetical protein